MVISLFPENIQIYERTYYICFTDVNIFTSSMVQCEETDTVPVQSIEYAHIYS